MRRPATAPATQKGLLINFECTISKPGPTYLASCDKLGVSDQGETESEARENLKVSLGLYLKEFKDSRELGKLLLRRGIAFAKLHADHGLPRMMKDPQFLPEQELKRRRGNGSVRSVAIRKILVPVFHWTRTAA